MCVFVNEAFLYVKLVMAVLLRSIIWTLSIVLMFLQSQSFQGWMNGDGSVCNSVHANNTWVVVLEADGFNYIAKSRV
jgi:hypothetical protein